MIDFALREELARTLRSRSLCGSSSWRGRFAIRERSHERRAEKALRRFLPKITPTIVVEGAVFGSGYVFFTANGLERKASRVAYVFRRVGRGLFLCAGLIFS
jgi:hypothetical protein